MRETEENKLSQLDTNEEIHKAFASIESQAKVSESIISDEDGISENEFSQLNTKQQDPKSEEINKNVAAMQQAALGLEDLVETKVTTPTESTNKIFEKEQEKIAKDTLIDEGGIIGGKSIPEMHEVSKKLEGLEVLDNFPEYNPNEFQKLPEPILLGALETPEPLENFQDITPLVEEPSNLFKFFQFLPDFFLKWAFPEDWKIHQQNTTSAVVDTVERPPLITPQTNEHNKSNVPHVEQQVDKAKIQWVNSEIPNTEPHLIKGKLPPKPEVSASPVNSVIDNLTTAAQDKNEGKKGELPAVSNNIRR